MPLQRPRQLILIVSRLLGGTERKSPMGRTIVIPAITWLALSPVLAEATDLTKIDRTIAKEPTYKTKPKYGLLVFGPEAKAHVWLVLDGDVLYVDKNGNGDLTEKDE